MTTKIIAWNLNGIRSIIDKKYLYNLIDKEKPNIICFGETKLTCPIDEVEKKLKDKISGYRYRYFSQSSVKKGYSGTAIFSKKKPLNVIYGIKFGNIDVDQEGRVITLEFDKYFLIHVYTPNSGQTLQRLKYRTEEWDSYFRKWIQALQNTKNVVVCGDLNVANEDIDIHNPKGNKRTAGFTDEERTEFKKYLNNNNLKLIDTYRFINPTKVEYSYWSYRFKSREKNKGWRIDYFLVSEKLKNKVINSEILTDIMGSDHAPIKLKIKI
jgi:exodeoxyribonuclease III